MTFKFVAKNLQTGKTGAVTVKADREQVARQKLTLGGYEVVRLMRVCNGQESALVVSYHGSAAPRAPRPAVQPSRQLILKIKLSAAMRDLFSPFALLS